MTKKMGLTDEELIRKAGSDPEFEKLKDQNKRLIKENKTLQKAVADEDALFNRLSPCVQQLPLPDKIKGYKPPESHTNEVGEVAVIMCDEHQDEIVESSEMEGLASYNWQTVLSRAWFLTQKVIELVNLERLHAKVEKLHVWKLGDQVTTSLHEQDAVGLMGDLPKVVPCASYLFAQQIMHWSQHFDEISVVGVPGNHPRTTKKVAYKKAAERNWDRGIYLLARMMSENAKNVQWDIPQSMSTVADVLGWKCYLTHGAEIRMNNRTPYYPIEATMQREQGMRRQALKWFETAAEAGSIDVMPDVQFDLSFMGHFHHKAVLSDSIYICPSSMGMNQYSKSNIHSMSLPRQQVVFFHRKHGIVVDRVINLMFAEGKECGFIDPLGLV